MHLVSKIYYSSLVYKTHRDLQVLSISTTQVLNWAKCLSLRLTKYMRIANKHREVASYTTLATWESCHSKAIQL